jgi:DNA repair exonuclease SbcCD ATPase subunit
VRLLSARVRSYRIHQDLTVEFDPARTLVGGPNESGKSTLIEAIHRGLFLKATVTGEAHHRMQSTRFAGHPEVEVRFEARGAQYELAKRFSGQTGTTRLTQVGGSTWLGEEAQARTAELLGVSAVGGGRGVDDRVSEQWSHLWVWQGKSLDDPCGCVDAQQEDLLQRLQESGGAVAMQSELDGRVAARFSRNRGLIFVASGKPKKGSDLERAQAECIEAAAERAAAADRVDTLRQAAEGFEEASAAIERLTGEFDGLTLQRQDVEARVARVDELRRCEERQAAAFEAAAQRLTGLQGIETGIAELRSSFDDLERSLRPREEAQARREVELAGVREQKTDAEHAYERALEATRDSWRRKELAAAYVALFEKQARCDKLDGYIERVRGLEQELAGIRGELARLVPLDQQALDLLRDLESRSAQAGSALRAMATEVEVVTSETPVQVGAVRLSAGGRHTVSDPTEVTVGATRLRIHPGGGDSLAEAREKVRTLGEELKRALDGYGLASVAQASEMADLRTGLLAKERSVLDRLKEWPSGPSGLNEERAAAAEELVAVVAEVQRRAEQMGGAASPQTAVEARGWLQREEEGLRRVESDEGAAKAALEALRRLAAEKENALIEAGSLIEADKQRLAKYTDQLELLIRSHGEDEARATALSEAREAEERLEGELAGTRASLEALQPELLVADRERLMRALEQAAELRLDAQNRRAANQALLRSSGADDPEALLAQADARLEAAVASLTVVERKARAIALVDDLFAAEQRALADRFSQPLADKISAYLRCLFGPDARAVVSFENHGFKSIELARSDDGGTISFARLSGGTREQVAAAVRLAIAELLATGHDGSLPVVFDDAFAYSDPERVQTLQRMLDLGAARGLQIIVLTCNPSDYAGLGARQVALP